MLKQKNIQLIFTRDISLFTAEWWYGMLTKGIRPVFGKVLSDQIVYFNGKSAEVYRVIADMEALKKNLLTFPCSYHPFSLGESCIFRSRIDRLREMIEAPEKVALEKFPSLFRSVYRLWSKTYPHFMMGVFLPGAWKEDFSAIHKKKGDRIIERFFDDRIYSEGIFESIDIFARSCLGRYDIPASAVPFVSKSEAESLIFSKEFFQAEEIVERKRGCVSASGKIFPSLRFSSFLNEHGYRYDAPKVDQSMTFLSGSVAYRDKKVRGKAYVILNYEDTKHFPPGAILVTPMTAPQHLAAMRVSKAIVTDEGGITCHAAITSRELKIPCVIATKVATKMIRMGDTVEVDTEQGSVNIISRA